MWLYHYDVISNYLPTSVFKHCPDEVSQIRLERGRERGRVAGREGEKGGMREGEGGGGRGGTNYKTIQNPCRCSHSPKTIIGG